VKIFVYDGQPARIVFGAGSLRHPSRVIGAFGARKALVLFSPG
jgi:maleylacetate reductase